MDGIAGLGIEVGAGAAAGLLVLLVEKWTDHRAHPGRGAPSSQGATQGDHASVNQAGGGSTAVVQQGVGHNAVFDHSTHTTTHNTYGSRGGGNAAGDGDDVILIFVGGALTIATLVAGFFLTQDYLRIAFAVLIGGVVGGGLSVGIFGAGSRKSNFWQVLAALPWLFATAAGTWLWGRWAGIWGEALPGLAELERTVSTVEVDASQGWAARVLDSIGGTLGVLLDHSPESMPGVFSILSIFLHFMALVLAGVFLRDALASARRPNLSEPSTGLKKRADRFDHQPKKACGGSLAVIVVCCGVGFFLVSDVILQG